MPLNGSLYSAIGGTITFFCRKFMDYFRFTKSFSTFLFQLLTLSFNASFSSRIRAIASKARCTFFSSGISATRMFQRRYSTSVFPSQLGAPRKAPCCGDAISLFRCPAAKLAHIDRFQSAPEGMVACSTCRFRPVAHGDHNPTRPEAPHACGSLAKRCDVSQNGGTTRSRCDLMLATLYAKRSLSRIGRSRYPTPKHTLSTDSPNRFGMCSVNTCLSK